ADPASRGDPRAADDERHVHRRVVDEDAVRLLAVLAEALAVIGERDDERVVEDAASGEPLDERADRAVHERDLAVVRAIAELTVERRRRLVVGVRIVEVEPGEEGRVAGFEPGPRRGEHLVGRALREEELPPWRRAREVVVVDVEALPETVLL